MKKLLLTLSILLIPYQSMAATCTRTLDSCNGTPNYLSSCSGGNLDSTTSDPVASVNSAITYCDPLSPGSDNSAYVYSSTGTDVYVGYYDGAHSPPYGGCVIRFTCDTDPYAPPPACPEGSELEGEELEELEEGNPCNPVCAGTAGINGRITGSSMANGDIYYAYGCKGYAYNCNDEGTSCLGCQSGLGSYSETGAIGFKGEYYITPPTTCENLTGVGDEFSPSFEPDMVPPPTPTTPCSSSSLSVGDPCLPTHGVPDPTNMPPPPIEPPDLTAPPPSYTPGEDDGEPPEGSIGRPGFEPIDPGSAPGGGSGEVENPGDTISYGAFPSLPSGGWYTRRYASISDLYANNMAEMAETPLFSFVNAFSLPVGFGTPPSWEIDFTNIAGVDLGTFTLEPPTWLWNVLFWFTQICAFFYCRKIIFGA